MVRRFRQAAVASVVVAITAAAACSDRRATAAAETPQPQPTITALGDDAAPVGTPSRASEKADRPVADPPAEIAKLPDGTAIEACADSPAGMACVPGGPFIRGSDDGLANARPAATVHLQTFYIDVYEVTYEQYGACMKAGACPRARPRYLDFDHPKMPMTGVSWFDAKAYCEAQGKRLPTEAQWEKAARGPDGAMYPWGDDPITCARAIYRDASGRGCGLPKAKSKPETSRPWDVGSRPVGVYGLYDMVGNSWEWVHDWYSRSYADCGDACAGVDPKGPCDGAETCAGHSNKIVRGGSWYWEAEKATGIYRRPHVPSNDPFHHFGFRCAASIEQAHALTSSR